MPNTYKVQAGDTVSGIAQKLGVSQDQVTGYKSGNASKIGVGEDLTIGGGQSSPGPSAAQQPADASSPFDFNGYYKSALEQLKPGYDQESSAVSQSGQIQQNTFETLAKNVEKQEPIVRQQYAALAEQFKARNQQEVATADRVGTADMGNAKAALANSGLSTATGSFYQPVAEAEASHQDRLSKISTSYNADSTKLQADMSKETTQLESEASQYRAQGSNVMATVIERQAELKSKFDNSARTLASDYLKAANDQQKFEIQERRLDLSEKHQQQMEELAQARLAFSESKSSNGSMNQYKAKYGQHKDASSGDVVHDGVTFYGPGGEKVTAATFLRGRTGTDPSRSQIAAIIGNSGKADDERVADELRDQSIPLQELAQKYPYILGD